MFQRIPFPVICVGGIAVAVGLIISAGSSKGSVPAGQTQTSAQEPKQEQDQESWQKPGWEADQWLNEIEAKTIEEKVNRQKATFIPTAEAIAKFESRIKSNPAEPRNYVLLGRLNLRFAKETDDFNRFLVAEQQFKKAIAIDDSTAAKTYLARAYLAQHRFHEAAELATAIYEKNPGNELALATMGDANMQLGNYELASQTFEKLLTASQTPPLFARLARVKELMGDRDKAFQLLKTAAEMQVESAGNASDETWFFWRLGEFAFSGGDYENAEKYIRRGLQASPDDAHSLECLAKIQTAQSKNEQAIKTWRKAIDHLGTPPQRMAFAQLLEHESLTDLAAEQLRLAKADIDEEAADPHAGPAHARERVMYLLNQDLHPKLALELAEREMKVRQDIYCWDLLAWAQMENGQSKQAVESIEKALRHNTQDSSLWFHAGMIYSHQNNDANRDKAIECLESALSINPCFSIADAKTARAAIDRLKAAKL